MTTFPNQALNYALTGGICRYYLTKPHVEFEEVNPINSLSLQLQVVSAKKSAAQQPKYDRLLYVLNQTTVAFNMDSQGIGKINKLPVDPPLFYTVCGHLEQYHLYTPDKETSVRLGLKGTTLKITVEKIGLATKGLTMQVAISADFFSPKHVKRFLLNKKTIQVFPKLTTTSLVYITLLKT